MLEAEGVVVSESAITGAGEGGLHVAVAPLEKVVVRAPALSTGVDAGVVEVAVKGPIVVGEDGTLNEKPPLGGTETGPQVIGGASVLGVALVAFTRPPVVPDREVIPLARSAEATLSEITTCTWYPVRLKLSPPTSPDGVIEPVTLIGTMKVPIGVGQV
jgi:hypothetical protein